MALILNKRRILTPKITEFLENANLLVECQNGELAHMIYVSRDGKQLFNFSTWHWLHPYINKSTGYYCVDLKLANGKWEKGVLVHRLVARIHCWRSIVMADLRKPWEKLHVHHINGNKLDNRPENLEIMDPGFHSGIHNGDREIVVWIPDGMTVKPGIQCMNIDGKMELVYIPEQERQQVILQTGGEIE